MAITSCPLAIIPSPTSSYWPNNRWPKPSCWPGLSLRHWPFLRLTFQPVLSNVPSSRPPLQIPASPPTPPPWSPLLSHEFGHDSTDSLIDCIAMFVLAPPFIAHNPVLKHTVVGHSRTDFRADLCPYSTHGQSEVLARTTGRITGLK
jgi:hypothetical protein